MDRQNPADHYELLQVSRNAHPHVITRAFRLLATLYHPDNMQGTADEEMFRQVVDAYQVLSDPGRREAYDREMFGGRPLPRKAAPPIVDAPNERQLRPLILQALYDNRRSRPHRPGLSLLVISELFGCSIDEMQFPLWYLRGKKLIETGRDEELVITIAGVDHVEAAGGPERAVTGMLALPPLRHVIQSHSESEQGDLVTLSA